MIGLDYSNNNASTLSDTITYDKQIGDTLDYQKTIDTIIQNIKFAD